VVEREWERFLRSELMEGDVRVTTSALLGTAMLLYIWDIHGIRFWESGSR
jgi:hypothetical protein